MSHSVLQIMQLLHQKDKKLNLKPSLFIGDPFSSKVESITETVSEPIKQNIFEGHSESWVGEFRVAEKGTCAGGHVIFAGLIYSKIKLIENISENSNFDF